MYTKKIEVTHGIFHGIHILLESIFITSQLCILLLQDRLSSLGSSPWQDYFYCIVSLGETLYSHSTSLCPGVKLVPENIMLRVTLKWISIPSRGVVDIPSSWCLVTESWLSLLEIIKSTFVWSNFRSIQRNIVLIENALRGDLVIPEFNQLTKPIEEIYHICKENKDGKVMLR